MTLIGRFLQSLAFLLVAGCAAYKFEPLTVNHPANPQAMAAPEPPVSNTLAYARSDMPSAQPASATETGQQAGHEAHHPSAVAAAQTVTGEGKVIATVPSANQIVVEHGEIKGFMEAMTMGYRTEPATLLQGLKPGDKIRFIIDVQKKAIVKIENLNQ